jgi:hypothetical protein
MALRSASRDTLSNPISIGRRSGLGMKRAEEGTSRPVTGFTCDALDGPVLTKEFFGERELLFSNVLCRCHAAESFELANESAAGYAEMPRELGDTWRTLAGKARAHVFIDCLEADATGSSKSVFHRVPATAGDQSDGRLNSLPRLRY